ncbi:hypothetical protein BUALT_Bualt04G0120000 [Buddleja alternifolia]|uniref:Protein Lines C-terminal domain-containing protein n=1 Tax=Buddleja alternifolia TaxID=168488 RepID=A0AAV6XPL2_9LAMI|nr:hypothetical protein BUALT_Bualt04G0120000 [Buddleja alternifolia]
MGASPEYLRLCRLLDEYLQSLPDLAAVSLTEKIEKDLLIALSKELLAEHVDDRECSVSTSLYSDNRHCLAKIIGDLMFLLAVKSQYVQHLAGNTLVAVAEFVVTSEMGWDDFMHLLCFCLELAICNSLASSSRAEALETRYPDYDPSISKLLKLKLKIANWFVVAAIFRILRNILKFLKQDYDDKIMKAYLDSVSSLISNLPLDILSEIYGGHSTDALKSSDKDVLLHINDVQPREMTEFFGNFIQFLCSLVAQSSCLEDGDVFSSVIFKIINLVPKLIAWCHGEFQSAYHVRISHYFRHKVLMLMIKLSSRIRIKDTILMSWIHLVHKYFEDLLLHPISGAKFDQDDFLEGSPFCTSISAPGKQNISSRHLQRLTVFIFLKCSLNLVSMEGSPDEQNSAYEKLKHYSDCQSQRKGLIEFHKWLQAHVPADIITNHELYFQRCVRFTLSFLQLFMHEDDILFEMLLQLLRVPLYLDRLIIKDEPLAEVKNRPVVLASDLFNPIFLFHLFLSEILYDHQVLLDYLISKDTGSSCAEYLLRSLRIVCDSWNLFVGFPGVEEGSGQLCPKRQKVSVDSKDFKGELSPLLPLKDGGISTVEKEHNEGYENGRNYREPFMAARDCLASLRSSINSLNQKDLFPYNPQALLRRSVINCLLEEVAGVN